MIITSHDIDDFAKLCNETKRASFSITRNVKTGKWKVRIGGKAFVNAELGIAIILATQFINENREQTNGHLQLKDYALNL